ncbi:AraC family transcriptional regulator [Marinomonas sp. TW1]|uniref:AraC family transcriptional regulator n=1 Tax=Marinomonas sp. TW1 TaxID=1561203 RepID=UPI0007AFD841|nr:AraC family transcriptional regulator [Marinomonas sp. TW1]
MLFIPIFRLNTLIMDLLGDVLRSLNVFSHSMGTFSLGRSNTLSLSEFPSNFVYMFSNRGGDFWVQVEGCEACQLEVGDSILILGGRAHRFGMSLEGESQAFGEIWKANNLPEFGEIRNKPIHLAVGNPDDAVSLLSMAFTVDEPQQHSLLRLLPPYILIPKGGQLDTWVNAADVFCQQEFDQNTSGFSASALYLTHLIFGECIRSYINATDLAQVSWMRGLSDSRIGLALSIMHTRCEEPWSAVAMAAEVGMSRASFARTFKSLVGQSPMDYLTDCRMQRAAQYLLSGNFAIGYISELIGYHSERAFRQAFMQRFGVTPRDYRKQEQKI